MRKFIRITSTAMLMTLVAVLMGMCFTLSSCGIYGDPGDYLYIITMKDSTQVKAWSVSSDGGGLTVYPVNYGSTGRFYYLSSEQYIKAEYVGPHNIYDSVSVSR